MGTNLKLGLGLGAQRGGGVVLTSDLALAYWDFTDTSMMAVERNGTGGNPGNGGTIGIIADKSPTGLNAAAVSDAARPLWQSGGYARHDLVDDSMIIALPVPLVAKLGFATTDGIGVYDASIPAGSWRFSPTGGYMPGRDLIAVCFFPSTAPARSIEQFLAANTGASGNYSGVTDFTSYWRGRSEITSFPLVDTSAGTAFYNTWNGCSSLTSFPAIDTSSGLAFGSAWRACTSLTTFPANVFDGCPGTNFTDAFFNCALSAQSVENIVVSIESNGTSGGTLDIDGGTSAAPNATAAAAISALTGRGWTVTTN